MDKKSDTKTPRLALKSAGVIAALILIVFLFVWGYNTVNKSEKKFCWSSHGNAEYYYDKNKCPDLDKEWKKTGSTPPANLEFKQK